MLSFKAGRCERRGETNWVDPLGAKGVVSLETSDDGLLHFNWKNRDTGETEEDLIVFEGDCSLSKVNNVPDGRVLVLKFTSSNQRYFFWLQDAEPSRDEFYIHEVNAMFADSTHIPPSAPPPVAVSVPTASTSAPPQQPATAPLAPTEEQLRQLREIIQNAIPSAESGPELSLADVITPQTLEPLLSRPELLKAIFPNLPADLPGERDADTLLEVIQSSAFKASIRGLDQALSTGLLGGLVTSLGLPAEAGTGVVPFLQAIASQATEESPEEHQMETD